MAFVLKSDVNFNYDALGPIGATPTLTFTSGSAPNLTVTAARIGTAPLVVQPQNRIAVPALPAGVTTIWLTIVGVQTADDIGMCEVDPPQVGKVLWTKYVGAGPGGASPLMSFDIHAS